MDDEICEKIIKLLIKNKQKEFTEYLKTIPYQHITKKVKKNHKKSM
jgi:hypothetical protein